MEYTLDHVSVDEKTGEAVAYVRLTVGSTVKTVCLPAASKDEFKTALKKKAEQVATALAASQAAEKDVQAAIAEIIEQGK
jgi:hypothetical protein